VTEEKQEVGTNLMRLTSPELVISPEEWPCTNDVLNRHKEIENLSTILTNVEAPLVLSINAPWGGGKTTFIRLWRHYLSKELGYESLYFNAWECDFSDDPLLPMLSTIGSWISDRNESGPCREAWEKAKKYAPGLLKSAAVAATKAATFGALDIEDGYEKLASEFLGEGVTGNLIDHFDVQQNSLSRFKELLSDVLETLPEKQNNLIIFVDELDRCKPTFAIETLERIKHLFNIERVVFVLSMNEEQLVNSFQGIYGANFDGKRYLKRFIDLDYSLRIPQPVEYIKSQLYRSDIISVVESKREGSSALSNAVDVFNLFQSRFNLQLRDINQLITRFRITVMGVPDTEGINVAIIISLLILREERLSLYEAFKADSTEVNRVLEFFLGQSIGELRLFPEKFERLAGCLIGVCEDDSEPELIDRLLKPWGDVMQKLSSKSFLRNPISRMHRIAQSGNGGFYGNMKEHIFERVELAYQISF